MSSTSEPDMVTPPTGDLLAEARFNAALEINCPTHADPGSPCAVMERRAVVCRARLDAATRDEVSG